MTQPQSSQPSPGTLAESLRISSQVSPKLGFTFLNDGEEVQSRLNYGELDRRAGAIAAALVSLTVPGDRVILYFPPGLEFIEALFGCFYRGVVGVPTPWQRPNRPNPHLSAIVENSGATVALTTRAVLNQVDRMVAGDPSLGGLCWLAVEDLGGDAQGPVVAAATDDLALLQYTSGSTGVPKGVMLTHRALLANLEQMRRLLDLRPDRVGVSWLPPFHDMGLIGNLLQSVHTGMGLVLMPPPAFVQSPVRWLRAISRFGAYVSGGPNFAFELCTRTITPGDREGLDLSTWRVAYVGSEPVSAQTLDRFVEVFGPHGFARATFYPCFGLAEATLMVSGGQRSASPVVRRIRTDELRQGRVVVATDADAEPATQAIVGCGEPIPELELRVVDPDSGTPVGPGRVGEIWVAGPSVGRGYWGRPLETESCFAARLDGLAFLRTGDLGFVDGNELFISGRLKDLIIIRGRNHFPQDIEEAVETCHPGLRPGGVVAFGAEADGDTRLAIVCEVGRHHQESDSAEVVDAIGRVVADRFGLEAHAITLVRVSSLPRTSSGKSRRQECQQRWQAGDLDVKHQWRAGEAVARPTAAGDGKTPLGRREISDWLVSRIAQHRKTTNDRIDTREPFAAFGLDSVTMVKVSAELGDLLGTQLSPTLLYEAPTIDALSTALSAETPRADRGDEPPRVRHEPIAIIGAGCRFPGANSIESFWQLLRAGRDEVKEIPEGRWPRVPAEIASRAGGFLAEVDQFDPQFFGISPREAGYIDPQHRLLLEVAWEAIENAGMAADRMAGQNVGVFVGISGSDYGRLLANGPGLGDAYWGTGNALSMAANRISYHLDLNGPSLSIDTACSSSLVAVHLAVRSLRNGECGMALAGGVNLMLSSEVSVALSKAQMLSPTGLCQAFDAKADGYVRGEGCGAVLLKPLSDALRDRDPILAVIRGSALNQDGKSNGITAPNGASQSALVRSALRDAGATPEEVSYVEAHGTGTILGDPIEVEALKAALFSGSQPCAIGTLKTNIGHLEAAAGIAGLIKTALQLRHGELVPHLHLEALNPHISLDGSRFYVPDKLRPWPTGPQRRLAGVSSFGFGGSNAHVVLEEPPPDPPSGAVRPIHLLTLSARSEPALGKLAERFQELLSGLPPAATADVCATANAGRSQFAQRLAVSGATSEELRDGLAVYRAGQSSDALHSGRVQGETRSRITFLYTGQGSQFPGMGRGLYRSCATFRKVIDRCDEILRGQIDRPLSAFFSDGDTESFPASGVLAQVSLFALELALTETWRSWGVVPAAVMGHSLGEYAAACAAGVFDLEDGLRLVAGRARLMEELCGEGEMAAVFGPYEVVAEQVAQRADTLAIAAINGPRNIVISGARESVRSACQALRRFDISSQALHVSRAFHSPLIEPALDAFAELAAGIRSSTPSIALVSNLSGRFAGAEVCDASYWRRHAREPVRFLDGLQQLHGSGSDLFIEIGPTRTLSALGLVSLPSGSAHFSASLRKGGEDWRTMLDTLGSLYVRGVPIDWAAIDADEPRRRVLLPTYPFERERCWLDGPSAQPNPDERRPAPSPITPIAPPAELVEEDPDLYEVTWESRTRWEQEVDRLPATDLAGPVAIARSLEPLADALYPDRNPSRGPVQRADFDRLATDYVVTALAELGWEGKRADRFSEASLADRLGVPPKSRRFFGRLLQILAEAGCLRGSAAEWEVVGPLDRSDTSSRLAENLERYPQWSGELQLAGRCGAALARVLRGEIDPLEVIFPEGSPALLENLYEDSPVARLSNRIVAEAIEHAIERLPKDRVLRVLELGAGTGGTTSYVLPKLPSDRCEYVFSDVSSLFSSRAKEKFRDYDFLEYRVLDLEQDPSATGFAPHQFDLILAANVVHATADLRRALQGIRRLLVPSGLLVLLEGTGPQRLPDLIFGMAGGWWKFTDTDLRGDHPLIPRRAWLDLLETEGFLDATTLPAVGDEQEEPDQTIILARAPAVGVGPKAAPRRTREMDGDLGWLIFSDGAVGASLAAHLRGAGQPCVLVAPGPGFSRLGAGDYLVRPHREEDFRQLLRSARTELETTRLGVVHLWSLDPSTPADGSPGGEANEVHGNDVGSVLRLVEASSAGGSDEAIDQLWLVTRGATAAGRGADRLHPEQAPLWGLGRALQEPHRRGKTRLIDLDPGAGSDAAAERLAWEVLNPDREDALAFRRDLRLAARITPLCQSGETARIRCGRESVYLVVGEAVPRGLQVARWIAARGGGEVVIVEHSARNDPAPAAAAWGHSWTDAASAGSHELLELGVTVRTATADLSNERTWESLLADLGAGRRRDVRGVVILSRHGGNGFDPESVERGLRPTLQATWALRRILKDTPIDFFVMVGSPAALLGGFDPVRAADAAAGSFFGAMAHAMRRDGQPALAVTRGVRWGAGEPGPTHDDMASALDCLDRSGRAAQVAPLRVHWPAVAGPVVPPALDRLPCEEIPIRTDANDVSHESLLAAAPERRRDLLQEILRAELGRVLSLSPARVTLHSPVNSFGLDSLMAIQLKNRIEVRTGVSLSVATVLAGLTIADIAAKMSEELSNKNNTEPKELFVPVNGTRHHVRPESQRNGTGTSEGTTLEQMVADLDALPESELDSLIDNLMAPDGTGQDWDDDPPS